MRCALTVLVVSSLAFARAPIPMPKPLPEDLKALQGEWVLVSGEGGLKGRGKTLSAGPGPPLKISGKLMTNFLKDKTGEVVLDSKKKPCWIDFKVNDPNSKDVRGIYTLEGDTLTICWGHYRERRPTNFDVPKVEWYLFLKYQRKKP